MNVNTSLMRNSEGVTFDQMNKEHLTAVTDVVSYDFRKIGYGVTGSGVVSYSTNEITFNCDLYNDGTKHQVTWKYDKTVAINSTTNPNDGMLTRTVDGKTTNIPFGVTKFNIILLDSQGKKTTSIVNAKQFKVEINCQSPVKSFNNYFTASWQQTFTPLNI